MSNLSIQDLHAVSSLTGMISSAEEEQGGGGHQSPQILVLSQAQDFEEECVASGQVPQTSSSFSSISDLAELASESESESSVVFDSSHPHPHEKKEEEKKEERVNGTRKYTRREKKKQSVDLFEYPKFLQSEFEWNKFESDFHLFKTKDQFDHLLSSNLSPGQIQFIESLFPQTLCFIRSKYQTKTEITSNENHRVAIEELSDKLQKLSVLSDHFVFSDSSDSKNTTSYEWFNNKKFYLEKTGGIVYRNAMVVLKRLEMTLKIIKHQGLPPSFQREIRSNYLNSNLSCLPYAHFEDILIDLVLMVINPFKVPSSHLDPKSFIRILEIFRSKEPEFDLFSSIVCRLKLLSLPVKVDNEEVQEQVQEEEEEEPEAKKKIMKRKTIHSVPQGIVLKKQRKNNLTSYEFQNFKFEEDQEQPTKKKRGRPAFSFSLQEQKQMNQELMEKMTFFMEEVSKQQQQILQALQQQEISFKQRIQELEDRLALQQQQTISSSQTKNNINISKTTEKKQPWKP